MNFIERLRFALTLRPLLKLGRSHLHELSRLNDNFESFLYHSKMPTGAQHKLLLAEAEAADQQSISDRARNILNITLPEDREQSELELAIIQAREMAKRGERIDPDHIDSLARAIYDSETYSDDNPKQQY